MARRSLFDTLQQAMSPEGAAPLTVSQLAARIDGALRAGLQGPVRVAGEVSGFRDRTHWYFDLKDSGAVVNAVMFRSAAARAGFVPENGREVVATGRVEFYAPGGKVSLVVDTLEPVGVGALELAFRKLCDELRGLGWFDPERKRGLPVFPRKVAVITSRTGAALQDVLVTMRARCAAVGVVAVDVRVQGEGAAGEVAAAIDAVNARAARLGVDAILVTRGGGSMEDLWAFNERIVAEAIVRSALPVVAAIGHETDTTIAELVADERCATPTQAAMRLTPDAAALHEQLDSKARRMSMLVRRQIEGSAQRVGAALRHPAMADPRRGLVLGAERLGVMTRRLAHAQRSAHAAGASALAARAAALDRVRPAALHATLSARLAAADRAMRRAVAGSIAAAATRADAAHRQLASVGPRRVLERGFSVTLAPDGSAVRSHAQVRPGDTLRTVLADGRVESVVRNGDDRQIVPRAEAPEPRATRRGRGRSGPDPAQHSLFGG